MADGEVPITTSQRDFTKHNEDGHVFQSPTPVPTWSSIPSGVVDPELAGLSSLPPLKAAKSMPELGRSTTQRSLSSLLGYEKIPWDGETAPNAVAISKMGSIAEMVRTTGQSPAYFLGTIRQMFASIQPVALGDDQTSNKDDDPYTPDLEVKTKHRKKTGLRKWKRMRACLDTMCFAPGIVTLEIVEALGIERISELTKEEHHTLRTISGEELRFCGTVNLTWRGVPTGKILNRTRDFKTEFYVMEADDYDIIPFQIIIGNKTIWKHGILQGPVMGAKSTTSHHHRETIVLPPAPKEKDKSTFADRQQIAAEKRAKAEAKDAEQKLATNGEATEGHKEGNTKSQLPKISANGPAKIQAGQPQIDSHKNGSLTKKIRSFTIDSRKSAHPRAQF